MAVGEKEAVFFRSHPRPQEAVGLSQLSHALPPFGNGESVGCRQVGVLTVKKKEKESIGVAGLAMSCNIRFSAFHGTPFMREVLHADVPLLPPVTGVRLPMPEAGLPVTL